ncbi:MAG: EAL domain-containing protein [Candidatus Magnetominusculus sp. LBB02]|nr:EAL domain-containing protein [Candidatus Magnetominusculus sp. LBB02]
MSGAGSRNYITNGRFAVIVAVSAIVLLFITFTSVKNAEVRKLHENAQRQAATYNRNLLEVLNIYETFPKLLSERPSVIEFVRHPERGANINDYLLKFNDSAGSESTYIMNADGIVIASSNYKKPASLVGKDLSFREYFRSAIKGTPLRFIAVGVYTKTPGYYVSYPIRNGRQIIGVVVVKYEPHVFALHNALNDEIFMIADKNGVIFYSNDERYTFRTLSKLSDDVLKEIKDARQYENISLLPLPVIKKSEKDGLTLVTLSHETRLKSDNQTTQMQYLQLKTYYKDADWNIVLLVDTAKVNNTVLISCLYVLLLMVAVYLIGIYLLHRIKARAQLMASYNDLLQQKKENESHIQEQEIIKSILSISLLPDPLDTLLKKILVLVVTNPWISLQSKGCIFLTDEESCELRMSVSHNFSDGQLAECETLPFGKCLCGTAAATREIVFSEDSSTDERHSISYGDMEPHGHYCIPITSGDRLLGVFNVYLAKGRQHEDDIFLKSIARTIAGVIVRKEAEAKTAQSYLIQDSINAVLQLAIKTFTLNEYLEQFLELISTVPWLSEKKTGCIFLIGNNPNELEIAVHRGFPPILLDLCRRLPIGGCMCGRCAYTGQVIFSSELDSRHEISYDGIEPHGHYCIPIKVNERVIGVINMYVEHGHIRTMLEEEFFISAANTLSGIIERKRMEEKLEYMANNDSLTGLPNRVLFFDRLSHEIKSSARFGYMIGILYIDIDNFKIINETLGHDCGDKLIKSIGDRLLRTIRESDTLSRMSGDEFTVILSNINTVDKIEFVTNKLLTILKEPYEINGQPYTISASAGVSVFPSDAGGAGQLLKHAETAMHHAKNTGKDNYLLFRPEMDEALTQRILLEKELRLAIERDELVLHYQPQIDIASGKIIGAEALVRWQHPEKGLIFPDKFISVAEDTGLIIPLGEQVLYKSCKQNNEWQGMGLPSIVVAVNVSATQISWNYDLAEMVFSVLERTKMSPECLEVEITESFCMQNVDSTISMLRRFNAKGINVAIDDFGTGYSSLSYLKHLPFKKLKVDRSFVNEITKNQDDLTIVKTIIDMSHNLRLKVIAEGVETKEQLDILRTLGCDEIQGYLFSRPVTPDKFAVLLKDGAFPMP